MILVQFSLRWATEQNIRIIPVKERGKIVQILQLDFYRNTFPVDTRSMPVMMSWFMVRMSQFRQFSTSEVL